jgi:hypothetical protein
MRGFTDARCFGIPYISMEISIHGAHDLNTAPLADRHSAPGSPPGAAATPLAGGGAFRGEERSIAAFEALEWQVCELSARREGGAALRVTDARGLEVAFAFDREELLALHAVIGDVVERQHLLHR